MKLIRIISLFHTAAILVLLIFVIRHGLELHRANAIIIANTQIQNKLVELTGMMQDSAAERQKDIDTIYKNNTELNGIVRRWVDNQ
jgi:hypothetical protein